MDLYTFEPSPDFAWDKPEDDATLPAVTRVEPWRFEPPDSVDGSSWKASTHNIRLFGGSQLIKPTVVANGVIVFVDRSDDDAELQFKTAQGDFAVRLGDIPYGVSKNLLNNRVLVERSFGFASHELATIWLGTSVGTRRRWVQPIGSVELNSKAADLSASAWGGQATKDFTDIDVAALADDLAVRLGWGTRRIELPAGRYPTILPPSAVADLMVYLAWSMGGRPENANWPLVVHHWRVIHAEGGTFMRCWSLASCSAGGGTSRGALSESRCTGAAQ
jgi:hypothetical protein